MGSALGQMGKDGSARLTVLEDERGHRLRDKVEGLSFDSRASDRLWVLIDGDNPLAPSDLCEVELSGSWNRWNDL
jgi:hypothetical protein